MPAIVSTSDEDLRSLGLKARGDIIALRTFCALEEDSSKNGDKDLRKRQLAEAVKNGERLSVSHFH